MMPSAPPRSAVSNPFLICWGDPSVAIVLELHPSLAAASATILPWSWQAAAPQLMNTSFLPDGTLLSIGVVTVMSLGRLVAAATTAFAWVSAALPLELLEDLVPESLELPLSEPPHPAAAMANVAPSAASPAARRYRLLAGVIEVMCLSPLLMVWL
jgi:hypothetical protein